ncbi:MAG: hypothetical protein MUF86_00295 [Akkermansiaceae bacterium]|jgi:hypothetical protein|nr:hypothetical protein [Akkermansiaceae bacterium]MCU0776095.1 hypothetical protein [Akkermansiaceae bacterium]
MSLKGFHIVFMSVSLLLFVFLIVWGFLLAPEKSAYATVTGVSGIIGTLLVPVYGSYFLRKARRIHL